MDLYKNDNSVKKKNWLLFTVNQIQNITTSVSAIIFRTFSKYNMIYAILKYVGFATKIKDKINVRLPAICQSGL